jgi:hypothetical protein
MKTNALCPIKGKMLKAGGGELIFVRIEELTFKNETGISHLQQKKEKNWVLSSYFTHLARKMLFESCTIKYNLISIYSTYLCTCWYIINLKVIIILCLKGVNLGSEECIN